MDTDSGNAQAQSSYALDIADSSHRWYVQASTRARRAHWITELAVVVFSASIPMAAVFAPRRPQLTALLGSILVILAGIRAIFHWQENYLRFGQAREAVEEQRRLYHTGAEPYEDPTNRDAQLVRAVTRIEHEETGQWIQLANKRPDHNRD